MNRKIVILIIVGIGVLALVALIYNARRYMPKYRWYENFNYDNDQPYGAKVFYEMLNSRLVEEDDDEVILIQKPLSEALDIEDTIHSTVFFIGYNFYSDTANANHLLNFIDKGNDVFIASQNIPESLLELIHFDTIDYKYYKDSIVTTVVSTGDYGEAYSYDFHYKFIKQIHQYSWLCIDSTHFADFFEEDSFKALSRIDSNHVNFFSRQIGSGRLFIHTNPLFFTNYHMITDNGFEYANTIISQLNPDKIYWDNFSRFRHTGFGDGNTGNPLSYLLSVKSLRWAWYIMLSGVVLFLVFRSKREQNIIPMLEKRVNTSVEYVKAIGTLYFKEHKHAGISEEIMNLFLSYIRNKYDISTKLKKEELKKQISIKSGLPLDYIEKIYKAEIKARFTNDSYSHEAMVELHRLIEYFYKNCK